MAIEAVKAKASVSDPETIFWRQSVALLSKFKVGQIDSLPGCCFAECPEVDWSVQAAKNYQ